MTKQYPPEYDYDIIILELRISQIHTTMSSIAEYVLSTSSSDAQVLCWDLRTLNVVSSFKANPKCGRNGIAQLGSNLLIGSQQDKAAMRIWAWGKDQPIQRFSGPERMPVIACSPDGNFIVGGSATGTLYIWQAASGRLLRFFPGHFKAVTVLKFTTDGMALVSAGDDGVVNVWNTVSLVDPSTSAPKPAYTWSDHSLPVTGVYVGTGTSSSCRVVTVSLDRTAKLWDMSTGKIMCTLTFPAGLTSVTMDAAEFFMCVGASDGFIYKVEMFRHNVAKSTGGTIDTANTRQQYLSHTMEVTSLELSYDCNLLVSGSLDGNIVVWDLVSAEKLKTFRQHEGPVTNLMLALRPRSAFVNTTVPRDVPVLERYMNQGEPLDGMTLFTQTAGCVPMAPTERTMDQLLIHHEVEARDHADAEESQKERMVSLEIEAKAAKAEVEKVRRLNDQLYERLSKTIHH
eukprot:CFRG1376T1